MPTYDTIGRFATDTSWDTAGNWTSGEPIAGEDALLTEIGNAIVGSDQSGADLASVYIDNTCLRQIGTLAVPVTLASNLVDVRGTTDRFIKAGGAGIDHVYVRMNSPEQKVFLFPSATNGLLTNVYVDVGYVTIVAETGNVTLAMVGPQGTLEIAAASGGVVTVVNAGRVIGRELITTLYNVGGTVDQERDATDTLTTVRSMGGTLNFDYAGTIGTLQALGGRVNFNDNAENKTVNTAIIGGTAVIDAGPHVAITPLVGSI